MRALADVSTPAVLIDVEVLERNVTRMAERARAAGIKLRPHAKTHKLLEVGRLQLAAGAAGLSVAKTSEAEVFAAAGFDDIFIAYPVVGEDKARRLLALADRVRLAVGVDSVEGARTLSGAFAAAGRRLDVRLKVDVGLHRVGVEPGQAVGVARAVALLPGLRFGGVFTHAGQAYVEPNLDGVAAVGRHEGATLAAVAEALRAAGLAAEEVSVGSTPTARHAMTVTGVTECRPGNYVYHDGSQVSLGTCGLEDCAMTVLATVVSAPARDRAVLDAGSKTLSTDPLRPRGEGFGWVLGRRARLVRMSEEHGVLALEEGERLEVGERVRVLPNHACVVSNLHDRVLAVRGDTVEAEWRVAARGRVE
jgi:D-serine deaminase-like pyridoxal phosphate-dependent protein